MKIHGPELFIAAFVDAVCSRIKYPLLFLSIIFYSHKYGFVLNSNYADMIGVNVVLVRFLPQSGNHGHDFRQAYFIDSGRCR